jgi:hypothetical protein
MHSILDIYHRFGAYGLKITGYQDTLLGKRLLCELHRNDPDTSLHSQRRVSVLQELLDRGRR